MPKITFLLKLLLLSLLGQAQTLDGTYIALELISLDVGTTGDVSFYGKDVFPKEAWFHEVMVIIKGNHITVDKNPVHFDSIGNKSYSASDGGFLTYKGSITKSADFYLAKTKLVAHDYIGFSLFEPPKIIRDEEPAIDSMSVISVDTAFVSAERLSNKEIKQTHDVVKGVHGIEVFLPKGTVRQDYVIRPEKDGVWINNKFYRRVKGKAPNISFKK